ncbi:hypothetical protein PHJA_001753300 [Phtheirospermum japonicum]|uniref:Pectin acetylesterase n=1 Tax=Phtheirospermum japonicum TaxID=374723 RepID=A0A830CCP7_9LAMI|nr:hypothetical protein PHJA_001753300 [Phtheirospermum japonicum]
MFGWVITRVHLDRGFGSRANSWIVNLKGGGWYNNIRTCVYRKTTRRGSSNYFKRQIPFTGVLSNKASENPGSNCKILF